MRQKYIKHAGIKGMKWGVRRYQYEDGSLTPAGKKRYGSQADLEKDIVDNYGSRQNFNNETTRNRENLGRSVSVMDDTSKILKDASNIGANPRKSKVVNDKDYSKISDEDMRKQINRLSMERTYGELTGDTKKVRSGADWTREILQTAGATVAIAGSIAGIVYTISQTKNGNIKKKK